MRNFLGEFYLDTDWMRAAACRNRPEINFFPSKHESDVAARAICSTCPVAAPCLAYAMADASLVGIWGGTSAIGRRKIRERYSTTPRTLTPGQAYTDTDSSE